MKKYDKNKNIENTINNRKIVLFTVLLIYTFVWLILPRIPYKYNVFLILILSFLIGIINSKSKKIYFIALIMGTIANLCYRCLLKTRIDEQYYGIHNCIFKFGILFTVFHTFEFLCIVYSKPYDEITSDQYLLSPDSSREYELAIFCILIEFLLTFYFFPKYKFGICKYTDWFGLCCSLLGIMIRCIAIIQAGNSFNHLINSNLSPEHKLVTTGIYKWCRHPSYVGWSLFALGLQIMIGNIVSLILSCIVIFRFFKERIIEEEKVLLKNFKEKYQKYKIDTPFGFPFLN